MTVQYPFPVKYTQIVPNLEMAWCDVGKGDSTLLFIHGLAGYIPLWKYQIQALASSFRCIAVDLPGNGLSGSGDFPYSMVFYAESVARFIEAEKLDNVILCGHSMGGHIALILSLRYPHRFNKLVLIAPSGLESFATHESAVIQHFMDIGQYFYMSSSHIGQAIQNSFYAESSEAQGIISDIRKLVRRHTLKQWNLMIQASIRSMLNEQISGFLSEVQLPVLIIFGEKDAFIPNRIIHPGLTVKKVAEEGSGRIPNARLVLIPRAGHFAHIEKKDEVNQAILHFLTESREQS